MDISMDIPKISPLDSQCDRPGDLWGIRLYHYAVYLHIHSHVIPAVRGVAVRSKRCVSLDVRLWFHSVLARYVSQPGCCQGGDLAGWVECVGYRKSNPFSLGK